MNVDSMDQSQREMKVKYETDLANLREQVFVQHTHSAPIIQACPGRLLVI